MQVLYGTVEKILTNMFCILDFNTAQTEIWFFVSFLDTRADF